MQHERVFKIVAKAAVCILVRGFYAIWLVLNPKSCSSFVVDYWLVVWISAFWRAYRELIIKDNLLRTHVGLPILPDMLRIPRHPSIEQRRGVSALLEIDESWSDHLVRLVSFIVDIPVALVVDELQAVVSAA